MSFIVIEYKSRATFVHFSTLSVKTVMEVARWPVAPYGILSLRTGSPKREISVIICLGLNMAFLHHSAFNIQSGV